MKKIKEQYYIVRNAGSYVLTEQELSQYVSGFCYSVSEVHRLWQLSGDCLSSLPYKKNLMIDMRDEYCQLNSKKTRYWLMDHQNNHRSAVSVDEMCQLVGHFNHVIVDEKSLAAGLTLPGQVTSSSLSSMNISDRPCQLANEGKVLTLDGNILDLTNPCWQEQHVPLVEDCDCHVCQHHTKVYFHYLYDSTPLLAIRLLALHNASVFYG